MPTKNKRVNMGSNSTAGIYSRGEINTDWEILMNIYGTAYDSLDNVMLTRDPHKLDPATVNELKGRFLILKQIAKKHAPEKVETIKKIERISIDNVQGRISDQQARQQIRSIIHQQRVPNPLLDNIEYKIDAAQGIAQHPAKNVTHPLTQFMQQSFFPKTPANKQTKKKRGPTNTSIVKPLFNVPSRKKGQRMPNVADFFKDQAKAAQQQNNPIATFLNPPQPRKRKTTTKGRKR